MVSSYYLELWVPSASLSFIAQYLPLDAQKERSLHRLFEEHTADEPNIFAINQILDQWERLLPRMQDEGLQGEKASLWLEGQFEQSLDLALDPMSLMRLGQEQLSLCLSGQRQQVAKWEVLDPGLASRRVEIRDIWLEVEAAQDLPHVQGPVPVTVSFDDGTFWQARFVPMPYLQRMQFSQKGFFWEPDMVMVPYVNRMQVEKTIATLMQQQQFERAFANLDGDTNVEAENGQSIFSLQIIKEGIQDIPLAEIFGLSRANVSVESHVWRCRNVQLHQQHYFDYLHHYVDLIREHLPSLQKLGIQRKDISIQLNYRYQGSCNLELHPETLYELGQNGISLEIRCQEASRAVARSLE